MTVVTWDAATSGGHTVHAVDGWSSGTALCGTAVQPITTIDPYYDRPGDIDVYRPRCRRCTTKENAR